MQISSLQLVATAAKTHDSPLPSCVIAGTSEDKAEVAVRVAYSSIAVSCEAQILAPEVLKSLVILATPSRKMGFGERVRRRWKS